MKYRWVVGVTTVAERWYSHLPQTLASLKNGGFDPPKVFVDSYPSNYNSSDRLTVHTPRIGAFGNFLLALTELWIRSSAPRPCPKCDSGQLVGDHCNNATRRIGTCTYHEPTRFIMFQDDVCCVRNLRQYLDAVEWPVLGYLNLYTFLRNEHIIAGKPAGWHEACTAIDHPSHRYGLQSQDTSTRAPLQAGYGALALAFTRDAVRDLLTSPVMWTHPARATDHDRMIDNTVCEALNDRGWRQYVHNPSLVQHTGQELSIIRANTPGLPYSHCPYPPAASYPGDNTDALSFLPS